MASNQLPIDFAVAALPDVEYEPNALAEAIADRLTASSQENFAIFVRSTTEPATNVGLWFDPVNKIWKDWDDDLGRYTEIEASDSTLGYVLQVDDGINANDPDPDVFKVWVVLDGNGQSVDVRTFYSADWRSFIKGTANAIAVFKSTGEGLDSLGTGTAGQVLTSAGAGVAPAMTWAGHRVGDIKWSCRTAADAGWSACDFGELNRITYAVLFAEVGTAHGAGDGSNTFNKPDLRGRSPMGAGNGPSLTSRALGAKAGEESHTQTEAELAAHTHTLTEQTRTDNQDGASGAQTWLTTGSGRSTDSTGSSTPFNVVHPVTVLNAFIYTGVI